MAEEKAEKKKPIQKRTTIDKWKRKKWFKIIAPAEFNNKEFGETIAEKPKNLVGRTIEMNLADLSGQKIKRHITVKFQVKNVEGQQALTEVTGHEISFGFIARMIRRRNSKMEIVQIITTAEEKKLKIKTFVLSLKKLAARQEAAIRNLVKDSIEKNCTKKNYEQLMQEIIFGALAARLFKQAKKIAPIKRLEIIKTQVEK